LFNVRVNACTRKILLMQSRRLSALFANVLVVVVGRELLDLVSHGSLLWLPLALRRHTDIAVSTRSAIASKSCSDEMSSVSSKNSSENLSAPSMT
jgi:hypothetical protein